MLQASFSPFGRLELGQMRDRLQALVIQIFSGEHYLITLMILASRVLLKPVSCDLFLTRAHVILLERSITNMKHGEHNEMQMLTLYLLG